MKCKFTESINEHDFFDIENGDPLQKCTKCGYPLAEWYKDLNLEIFETRYKNNNLEQKNKKLEKALAVYADESHWVFDPFTHERIFICSSGNHELAQKALEGE